MAAQFDKANIIELNKNSSDKIDQYETVVGFAGLAVVKLINLGNAL